MPDTSLKLSLHTDSKGIMDLVKFLSPKHVILVHGEMPKMAILKEKIHTELQIPCYHPPNNGKVHIPSTHLVKANASPDFIRSCLSPDFIFKRCSSEGKSSGSNDALSTSTLEVYDVRVAEGVLVMEKSMKPMVIHQDELLHVSGRKNTKPALPTVAQCIFVTQGRLMQIRYLNKITSILKIGISFRHCIQTL